jgi:hypothetical protein
MLRAPRMPPGLQQLQSPGLNQFGECMSADHCLRAPHSAPGPVCPPSFARSSSKMSRRHSMRSQSCREEATSRRSCWPCSGEALPRRSWRRDCCRKARGRASSRRPWPKLSPMRTEVDELGAGDLALDHALRVLRSAQPLERPRSIDAVLSPHLDPILVRSAALNSLWLGSCRPFRQKMPARPPKMSKGVDLFGAGEGNRTLVVSLGSFCSAIELHPLRRR